MILLYFYCLILVEYQILIWVMKFEFCIFRFTMFCVLMLLITNSCVRDRDVQSGDRISVGDELPEFEVSVNDGSHISTLDLQGKTSVIVFFNTNCSDCRKLMPEIQKLYEMFSDAGDVVILAISREQDYITVSEYWDDNNYTIPFSAQMGRYVYELFALSGIPRVYIADDKLVVRYKFSENDLLDARNISKLVQDLRAL